MLRTVTSLVTRSYAWLRMVTQFTATLSVVTSQCTDRLRRVTVLYADLLGLLRVVTQFYSVCYAWLRQFTGMVTHRGWAPMRNLRRCVYDLRRGRYGTNP